MNFSPDGRKIAILSFRQVTIWDSITGKRICALDRSTNTDGFFVSIQFSPDGREILTSDLLLLGRDGKGVATTWDAKTGRRIRDFVEDFHNEQHAPYACFTPDGRGILSAADNGIAILWDTESGKEIRRFQIPGASHGPVVGIVFSLDGKRLITVCDWTAPNGAAERSVALWDVETGRLIKQFDDLQAIIGFSPADETFMILDGNRMPELWDGATGERLKIFHDSVLQ